MPVSGESVFEKISNEYYDLTASEQKTADYVLTHRQQTQFLSICQLAEQSGVAEATVSRFCRRLGYKGYNAFKLAVANAASRSGGMASPLAGEVQAGDSMEDMAGKRYAVHMDAIARTMEGLDLAAIKLAADVLEKAGRVLCMGQGGSMIMAREAAHLFSTVCGKFFPIEDGHMQMMAAATLSREDAVLFFSYSGAALDMLDALKQARRQGAKVILVTGFPKSPGAHLADVVLPCGAGENPLQPGSATVRTAQIFLLDILFTEFCRRDAERYADNRRRIADALAEKHI